MLLHITDMQASIELSQEFVCSNVCFVKYDKVVMCDTGDDDMPVTQVPGPHKASQC